MAFFGKLGSAVLLLAALGAAVAAVLAQGGRWVWGLDLFAHFAPVYGLVGLASLGLALLTPGAGRRRILAAAAVAVVASGQLVAPEFMRPAGPVAAAGSGSIKVIQFNMLRRNGDIRRVADWIAAQDPDVVTITEARHDLRDLLYRRGWHMAGAHGHLIIFTPQRYLVMNRPYVPKRTDLTFVNATYANAGGPMEVFTTHFRWPTDPLAPHQPTGLATAVSQLPRQRMILTGDFNAAPWSFKLRGIDRRLGLTRRDRAVATFPAQILGRPWPLPFLPIDHIYAGPGWATVKVERGPWLGSDHYPLIVTLAPVRPR